MIFDTKSSFIQSRLIWCFIYGVILLVFAIMQLRTIWTSKSSLVPLKGTIKHCDTYITTVSSRGRYGYDAKSQKAELIFYLNEHKKKFALVDNIGGDYRNEEYDRIKASLRRADSVTVWIRKSEIGNWEPKIFQIESNREKVLDYQAVRFKERPLTAFLLIMGLGCVGFPLYAFYHHWFNRRQAISEKLPTTSALQEQG
jgi:hypothetical protein